MGTFACLLTIHRLVACLNYATRIHPWFTVFCTKRFTVVRDFLAYQRPIRVGTPFVPVTADTNLKVRRWYSVINQQGDYAHTFLPQPSLFVLVSPLCSEALATPGVVVEGALHLGRFGIISSYPKLPANHLDQGWLPCYTVRPMYRKLYQMPGIVSLE